MYDPHGNQDDPHGDQPVESAGTALEDATAAVILLHGRGATATSILGMGREIHREGVALLAPQAAGNTWYPNPFTAPVDSNEPGRRSGLGVIEATIETAHDAAIPTDGILLVGFSQGACLASEYVCRKPTLYGGLAALSGGLIGQQIDERGYEGNLDGMSAFLGCSDRDPHIPEQRVHETAAVLDRLHADVETRIYEGMGHTVNQDELELLSEMVASL